MPKPDIVDHRLSKARIAPRNVLFALLVVGSIVIFCRPLFAVFAASFHNDQYSHILLILPVSIGLLYRERLRVFGDVKYCLPAGLLALLVVVTFTWVVPRPLLLSSNDALSLRMALFVSSIIIVFVFCFGIAAFRAATFPLLFLFFLVPVPNFVLDRIIWLLQECSTEVTFLMLKAVKVPVLKMGFVLSLPRIEIEVARECSGIRSSVILLIATLVLGHLFLRPGWRQIVVGLLVFPIVVAKNGLRIFILSILSVYVDPSFLTGNLHRHGGILFFSLALGTVTLVVWWLNKSQKASQHFRRSRTASPL